jgi:hypothetical protein
VCQKVCVCIFFCDDNCVFAFVFVLLKVCFSRFMVLSVLCLEF